MKKAALSLTVLLIATLLTACPDIFVNHSDGGFYSPPKAQASLTEARVGEPVKVTLSVAFGLDNSSSSSENPHSGFRLGACLIRDVRSPNSSRGGLCGAKRPPLPAWVVMSGGVAVDKAFDGFVVTRGERRRFEHTFTFTATQPGRVAVEPVMQYPYTGEGRGVPASESGDLATVVFE